MAELKMNAGELLSFDGFYYDHRIKLTVEGVNRENYAEVFKKLRDICGEEIYCGYIKCTDEYNEGCEKITVYPLDLINKTRYSFNDLMRIMYILTAENGCEWDKDQTMKSICPNMIEEAYELVSAIYNNDVENIVEEAGDVILQGVFHCVLGEKEALFDTTDVITGLCRKLITRHTHISKALKYAAKVGIGEKDKTRAAYKIQEDLKNIENGGSAEELIWDTIVLLRLMGADAEVALNDRLNKFIKAFKKAEEECGGNFDLLSEDRKKSILKEGKA